jgi:thiol-disulfide isomerase/thioredoxin
MKEIAAANNNVLGLIAVKNLKPLVEPAEMREFVAGLDPEISQEESIVSMLEVLAAQEATAVGKMFVDFEITQPDGTVKKLSDYVGKGKYILLDFWSPWCGPCRREMPNIKAVYEQYKGEKFDVISIAVWERQPVEVTIETAEKLGMDWIQINNAQREPAALYGVESIPHIILFGPDGTILKRGFHGAEIAEVVGSYLD